MEICILLHEIQVVYFNSKWNFNINEWTYLGTYFGGTYFGGTYLIW